MGQRGGRVHSRRRRLVSAAIDLAAQAALQVFTCLRSEYDLSGDHRRHAGHAPHHLALQRPRAHGGGQCLPILGVHFVDGGPLLGRRRLPFVTNARSPTAGVPDCGDTRVLVERESGGPARHELEDEGACSLAPADADDTVAAHHAHLRQPPAARVLADCHGEGGRPRRGVEPTRSQVQMGLIRFGREPKTGGASCAEHEAQVIPGQGVNLVDPEPL